MKNTISKLTLVAGLLFSQLAISQTYHSNHVCGHDMAVQQMENNYPGYKQVVNTTFQQAKLTGEQAGMDKATLTIPVVVHVVWNTNAPASNISNTQVEAVIASLRADYQRQNADATNLRAIFNPIAGNPEINFTIAGIERVETTAFFSLSFSGLPDNVKKTAQGGNDAWDPQRFLNIWVCNIEEGFLGKLLGYSYPPAGLANWPAGTAAPSADLDGVVIHYEAFNTNGTVNMPDANGGTVALPMKGRTVSHEVGHYLGLRHIWGDKADIFAADDCATDDGISDTPLQLGQSMFDCNVTNNTCDEGANDKPDLIENYMDYSRETCMNTFTQGQVNLMRGVLADQRAGLVTPFTSINEYSNKINISVSPNPTSDIVNINYVTENIVQSYTLTIKDMLGRNVKTIQGTGNISQTLDLSSYNSGIYTVNVQINDKVVTKKIILN